jgi:hypothetical protein
MIARAGKEWLVPVLMDHLGSRNRSNARLL